jgi:peptide/nickel transport system ATP-binding protein
MTPLLRAERISINIKQANSKREFNAVDSVSFEMYPGEILGIVGESGCGKSLTALSLAGLLPAAAELSGGSVFFEGRKTSALPEGELRKIRGKEIAFVFQEPALSLNPLIKTGRQIMETLILNGSRGQTTLRKQDKLLFKQEALDFMRRLGLPEPERVYDSYPHQLSGGMCQRVMIAIAMIRGPKLLVADEPTTALDVTTEAQILDLMKQINSDSGTGILFISHDLKVIRSICSRVLVMYAGRIVESGPVEELFAHPLHEYTRGLLGSIPGREQKGKALANIPGKVPSLEERGGAKDRGCPFAPRCASAMLRCFESFPEETVTGPADKPHSAHCILGDSSRGDSSRRGDSNLDDSNRDREQS